jgi:hypothetical protein
LKPPSVLSTMIPREFTAILYFHELLFDQLLDESELMRRAMKQVEEADRGSKRKRIVGQSGSGDEAGLLNLVGPASMMIFKLTLSVREVDGLRRADRSVLSMRTLLAVADAAAGGWAEQQQAALFASLPLVSRVYEDIIATYEAGQGMVAGNATIERALGAFEEAARLAEGRTDYLNRWWACTSLRQVEPLLAGSGEAVFLYRWLIGLSRASHQLTAGQVSTACSLALTMAEGTPELTATREWTRSLVEAAGAMVAGMARVAHKRAMHLLATQRGGPTSGGLVRRMLELTTPVGEDGDLSSSADLRLPLDLDRIVPKAVSPAFAGDGAASQDGEQGLSDAESAMDEVKREEGEEGEEEEEAEEEEEEEEEEVQVVRRGKKKAEKKVKKVKMPLLRNGDGPSLQSLRLLAPRSPYLAHLYVARRKMGEVLKAVNGSPTPGAIANAMAKAAGVVRDTPDVGFVLAPLRDSLTSKLLRRRVSAKLAGDRAVVEEALWAAQGNVPRTIAALRSLVDRFPHELTFRCSLARYLVCTSPSQDIDEASREAARALDLAPPSDSSQVTLDLLFLAGSLEVQRVLNGAAGRALDDSTYAGNAFFHRFLASAEPISHRLVGEAYFGLAFLAEEVEEAADLFAEGEERDARLPSFAAAGGETMRDLVASRLAARAAGEQAALGRRGGRCLARPDKVSPSAAVDLTAADRRSRRARLTLVRAKSGYAVSLPPPPASLPPDVLRAALGRAESRAGDGVAISLADLQRESPDQVALGRIARLVVVSERWADEEREEVTVVVEDEGRSSAFLRVTSVADCHADRYGIGSLLTLLAPYGRTREAEGDVCLLASEADGTLLVSPPPQPLCGACLRFAGSRAAFFACPACGVGLACDQACFEEFCGVFGHGCVEGEVERRR